MKGQVATEYIILAGFGLMLVLLSANQLYQIFYSYLDQNRISIAKNTVDHIGETADLVFSQGPPARVKIKIEIPSSVKEISFSNRTVLFRIKTSSGINDIFYNTVPQIYGSLPIDEGHYYVFLVAGHDHVNITVI